MKYEHSDPEVTKIMSMMMAQMLRLGEAGVLIKFAKSIEKTRLEGGGLSPLATPEMLAKLADVAIATAVAILLELAPNREAVCDLAIKTVEMALARHAAENFQMSGKKVTGMA